MKLILISRGERLPLAVEVPSEVLIVAAAIAIFVKKILSLLLKLTRTIHSWSIMFIYEKILYKGIGNIIELDSSDGRALDL